MLGVAFYLMHARQTYIRDVHVHLRATERRTLDITYAAGNRIRVSTAKLSILNTLCDSLWISCEATRTDRTSWGGKDRVSHDTLQQLCNRALDGCSIPGKPMKRQSSSLLIHDDDRDATFSPENERFGKLRFWDSSIPKTERSRVPFVPVTSPHGAN